MDVQIVQSAGSTRVKDHINAIRIFSLILMEITTTIGIAVIITIIAIIVAIIHHILDTCVIVATVFDALVAAGYLECEN